jgi:hypothetical protein
MMLQDVHPGPAVALIEYLEISFCVPPFQNPCSVGPHQLRSGLAGIPSELLIGSLPGLIGHLAFSSAIVRL